MLTMLNNVTVLRDRLRAHATTQYAFVPGPDFSSSTGKVASSTSAGAALAKREMILVKASIGFVLFGVNPKGSR